MDQAEVAKWGREGGYPGSFEDLLRCWKRTLGRVVLIAMNLPFVLVSPLFKGEKGHAEILRYVSDDAEGKRHI